MAEKIFKIEGFLMLANLYYFSILSKPMTETKQVCINITRYISKYVNIFKRQQIFAS